MNTAQALGPSQRAFASPGHDNQALTSVFNSGAFVNVMSFLDPHELPNARAAHSAFRGAINSLSAEQIHEINLALVACHTSSAALFRDPASNSVRVRTSLAAARHPNTAPEVLGEIAVRRLTFLQSPAGQDHAVANDRFLLALRDNANTRPETRTLLRRAGVTQRQGRARLPWLENLQVPAQNPAQNAMQAPPRAVADVIDAALDLLNEQRFQE